jgi:hypothetical protein
MAGKNHNWICVVSNAGCGREESERREEGKEDGW